MSKKDIQRPPASAGGGMIEREKKTFSGPRRQPGAVTSFLLHFAYKKSTKREPKSTGRVQEK